MTKTISAINRNSREPVKEIEAGCFVKRKKVNAFRYHADMIGIVLKIIDGSKAYIRWDVVQKTGQRHSTIQLKFLDRIV